jgi:hypothetical protein
VIGRAPLYLMRKEMAVARVMDMRVSFDVYLFMVMSFCVSRLSVIDSWIKEEAYFFIQVLYDWIGLFTFE